jgi:hypothetical protein
MARIGGLKEILLPCPHCAGENLGFSEVFRVRCYGCGSEGPTKRHKDAAARGWNRREYAMFTVAANKDDDVKLAEAQTAMNLEKEEKG